MTFAVPTFNTVLKRRAYTKDSITELVAQSQFGQGEIRVDPIGFELCGCINEH
jgi:hypothetical protein